MSIYHVEVKARRNEHPEALIRRFSRKVKEEGVIREVFDRKYYEKPSVTRRKKKAARQKVLNKLKREKEKQ
jgi:small subunit ribosomal protein S21